MAAIRAFLMRHYGGRRGLARHCRAVMMHYTGLLRRFTGAVEPAPGGRIVFVCKGNIARSAYAEARARALGFENIASAGLLAGSGSAATPDAVRVAAARGIDLVGHRARHVNELALGANDCVFVFELWQAQALAESSSARIFLLGVWARQKRPHIEDPYGRTEDYYAHCFGIIDCALQQLQARLQASPEAPLGGWLRRSLSALLGAALKP